VGFHHLGGFNFGLQPPLQLLHRLSGKLQEATAKGEKTMLGGGRALFASTAREQFDLVTSLLKHSEKESSPVRMVLNFPHKIVHSFQEKCIIPIEIEVHNSSWIESAYVKIEFLPPSPRYYHF
jgi:hypothetical protein